MSTDGIRTDWANKDFYAELGVTKDATQAEIKKAYRKLARANHPDSNPGDTAKHDKFKAVAEAYDVVGDEDKRKKYDEVRELYAGAAASGSPAGRPPGGRRLRPQRPAARPHGCGRRHGRPLQRPLRCPRRPAADPHPRGPGADVETNATISFMDAMDGVTISLRLTSDSACPECHGTGGKPGTTPKICPECEGAGFVVSSMGGAFSINETCPRCHGRQLIYDEACPTCHGSGRGTSARSIQARIPAGVKDGQRIRLRGKGGAGENGGSAGDLFVSVKVTPHRLFGRTGDNLTLDVPVSFDEVALGSEIKIPTLEGAAVTLKVPAGPRTAAPSASVAAAPGRRTAPRATCWRPSRCRCPPGSTTPPARPSPRTGPRASTPPCAPTSSRRRDGRRDGPGLPADAAVYVISVAAELSGLHPQTLRAYERMGLIMPGRTGGGGRRYSHRDIELLREIASLTAGGVGIEGVRRILELENQVTALRARNEELAAELAATRDALRQALTTRRTDPNKLPVLRQPGPRAPSSSGAAAAGSDPTAATGSPRGTEPA